MIVVLLPAIPGHRHTYTCLFHCPAIEAHRMKENLIRKIDSEAARAAFEAATRMDSEERTKRVVKGMQEQIETAGLLHCQIFADLEPFHFSGDLRREPGRIEPRDAGDPRAAGKDVCPGLAHPDADRADNTKPGYYDSAFGQLDPGARATA